MSNNTLDFYEQYKYYIYIVPKYDNKYYTNFCLKNAFLGKFYLCITNNYIYYLVKSINLSLILNIT